MKEYTCKHCKITFKSNKGDKNRTPLFCSRKCSTTHNGAKTEIKEKFAKAKIGKTPWNKGVKMWENKEHPRGTMGMKFPQNAGANCKFWKGGISTQNELERKSVKYKNWRTSVFERDNYTCVICQKSGCEIHADHIKPFSTHLELRYDINNGRTLCVECHKKTDTFGGKMLKNGNKIS
jgi:hypothetical protein